MGGGMGSGRSHPQACRVGPRGARLGAGRESHQGWVGGHREVGSEAARWGTKPPGRAFPCGASVAGGRLGRFEEIAKIFFGDPPATPRERAAGGGERQADTLSPAPFAYFPKKSKPSETRTLTP